MLPLLARRSSTHALAVNKQGCLAALEYSLPQCCCSRLRNAAAFFENPISKPTNKQTNPPNFTLAFRQAVNSVDHQRCHPSPTIYLLACLKFVRTACANHRSGAKDIVTRFIERNSFSAGRVQLRGRSRQPITPRARDLITHGLTTRGVVALTSRASAFSCLHERSNW